MFGASKTASVSTGGYQISRSLRFNSADSAYLNRTPASAGNRNTWTWSGWVKRSALSSSSNQVFFGWNGGTSQEYFGFRFSPTDTLELFDFNFSFAFQLITSQVFRDPSAWYHIVLSVDTTQATASNRIKLYVNGVQVTAFGTATYPTQNYNTYTNTTNPATLGAIWTSTAVTFFDGYMTEVNFVNAQQLTPSSFGETNAQTGVWSPIAYSGSYGTNGFYLNFSDNSNTTAATLGKDYSGNGNNWTPNNFSVTAGVGNDSLVDVPTPYGVDTGVGGTVRGNYCTMNPLQLNLATLSNGNLTYVADSASNNHACGSTLGVSSGKYYWEITVTSITTYLGIGIASASDLGTLVRNNSPIGFSAQSYSVFESGVKCNNSTTSAYQTGFVTGNVVGVAFDATNGKIWFGRNNVFPNSGDPAAGTNAAFTSIPADTYLPALSGLSVTMDANFGQRPFAYTAPSGFKALCTQNLPTPTIGATTATQAGKFFNPVLYTGTGSARSVTGIGFQPDWVWTKERSSTSGHYLTDAVRGNTKILTAELTDAEVTSSNAVTSFDSDGFSVGTDAGINQNGITYVGWNWKANGAGSSNTSGQITSTVSANTTSGFSIVTFTADGTTKTVGHGLGVAPKLYFVKQRNLTGGPWYAFTTVIDGSLDYLILNATDAAANSSYTAPTSTVIEYNDDVLTTQVAYCFAEVAGYSKIGSYTGNGSADGPFVFTGMRPAFLMIKRTDTAGFPWVIIDATRNTYNPENLELYPNTSGAEGNGGTTYIEDFLSNGFKIRQTDGTWNASGGTYIYMAIAQNPFKYSLAR